ncbi:ABC transporter substrate-binding protein [Defluviimonas sp. WL0024]|uniref:ABC transporter substrate-binding protein n=2 Tax=Albidovulum TaxID=205889 RepID=A0ABT3J1D2_9RHOB|nr:MULTISPECIES: ABC transporter substrate-binding protein [Defluviimonas]MCU9848081.1 ABC transporter substrate-binding protein [Defluviimonas sp. WL0024]MCW3781489.1 ABC transporter substrate-binding protein [Defluviimonas salinarum]
MRAALLALGLILGIAGSAAGFTVEEEVRFPAPGTERRELAILSTTDTGVLKPVIAAFQKRFPDVEVHYTVANSQEVFAAIHDESAAFDLVISSAMDLQMKLANDGFAAPYRSAATDALPGWAHWQDRLFAFAQENVVLIASRRAIGGLSLPQTRRDLIDMLRDDPERFRGRIGTYDPELSGAGYLFATQDARQSDSFWRLAEVMGGLAPRLYTSSNAMITDLEQGRLALAYNVLGSYAGPRLASDDDAAVVELEDYTLTLLRTGLIPVGAPDPALGGGFLDFLLGAEGRRLVGEEAGLPPIDEVALSRGPHLRPMRLDPGLLVFLDAIKRQAFLDEWAAALQQN